MPTTPRGRQNGHYEPAERALGEATPSQSPVLEGDVERGTSTSTPSVSQPSPLGKSAPSRGDSADGYPNGRGAASSTGAGIAEQQLLRARRQLRLWRIVGFVLLATTFALAVALGTITKQQRGERHENSSLHATNAAFARDFVAKHTCPNFPQLGQATVDMQRTPSTPVANLFEELDATELGAVHDFLFNQSDLYLTPNAEATPASNVIYLIELLPPPKDAAVAYLDGPPGTVPPPPRMARAVLFLGYNAQPKVAEVAVGPLPAPTNYTVLNIGDWDTRPVNQAEYQAMDMAVQETAAVLDEVMAESFGGFTYYNCTPPRCLTWSDAAPRGAQRGERQTWIWFMRFGEGYYLQPVGLEMLVNHSDNDPSAWAVTEMYYGGQLYSNASDLVAEYFTPNSPVTRVQSHPPQPSDPHTWSYKRLGDPNIGRPMPLAPGAPPQAGPRQYEPQGKRFTIDRNAVNYMGWTFQVGVRASGGLRLWDIRFGGERIVYELALQEILASYSGITPATALDLQYETANGLGASFHELIQGVDCPWHAAFLDATAFQDQDAPLFHPQSLCLWEQDTGTPLRRHTTEAFTSKGQLIQFAGVPGHALTLRGVATVVNSDYIVDVVFHLNGALEVALGLSGYVLAAPWNGAALNVSYPLRTDVGGLVADHWANWKVDLDVKGPANSALLERLELHAGAPPWAPRGINGPSSRTVLSKRLRHEIPENEDAAGVPLAAALTTLPVIINERSLNSWGSPAGYRIQVDSTAAQLLPDTWLPAQPGSWARSLVTTTVRHENESSSSSLFLGALPGVAPEAVNFTSFVNGESVRNTDLVSWVTVGALDVPTAESAPGVALPGRRMAFWLQPYNYFDADPSLDLFETLVVRPSNYTKRAQPLYERYGVQTEFSCVPPNLAVPFDTAEFTSLSN